MYSSLSFGSGFLFISPRMEAISNMNQERSREILGCIGFRLQVSKAGLARLTG